MYIVFCIGIFRIFGEIGQDDAGVWREKECKKGNVG